MILRSMARSTDGSSYPITLSSTTSDSSDSDSDCSSDSSNESSIELESDSEGCESGLDAIETGPDQNTVPGPYSIPSGLLVVCSEESCQPSIFRIGNQPMAHSTEPVKHSNGRARKRRKIHNESTDTTAPGAQKDIPYTITDWNSLYKFTSKTEALGTFVDCQKLPSIGKEMESINKLTGLGSIKDTIATHIMYQCQRERYSISRSRLNHMVFTGPPGCGKTTVAVLVAEIFLKICNMQGKIVFGTRQNMIGSYLGHTAKATQAVIDEAKDGILIIDEAYALGASSDDSDSYSSACMDTLNANLTEKSGDFICIIMGYRDQLESCFFGSNPGLKRRFPWVYHIVPYTPSELCQIFTSMMSETILPWSIPDNDMLRIIRTNRKRFKYHAATVRELVEKLEIRYSTMTFGHKGKPELTESMVLEVLKSISPDSIVDSSYDMMYI